MKRPFSFISNSLVEYPQGNEVLAYDPQIEVWKNVPANTLTTFTIGDINPIPNDKGATLSSQNELQLCAADNTHRGVLFGRTNYVPITETDTNTTLGYLSGGTIPTPNGENITVVGYRAYQNYAGAPNGKDATVIGYKALSEAPTIIASTLIGSEAGAILKDPGFPNNPAGDNLIAIGVGAAGRTASNNIRLASSCIHIGNNTDSVTQHASFQIVLGHNTTGSDQEMTVANYIQRVRWSGLLLDTWQSNRYYPLLVDTQNMMKRSLIPAWFVRRDGAVGLPPSTTTKIVFNTVLFDITPSSANYSTSTGEYTCPMDGIYFVQATFQITGAPDQTLLAAWISKNGDGSADAPFDEQVRRGSTGDSRITLHCTGLRSCVKGDKLSVSAFQNSGGTLTIESLKTKFSGHWVGPSS